MDMLNFLVLKNIRYKHLNKASQLSCYWHMCSEMCLQVFIFTQYLQQPGSGGDGGGGGELDPRQLWII